MNKLAPLRNRLDGLRRRRQSARWASGYSALASAVLGALLLAFIVDYGPFIVDYYHFAQGHVRVAGGHLGVGPRIVLLIGIAGVSLWAFFKFTAPFLGTHESTVDMALLVESQQLDPDHRDLVAAMQFESPEARQWGSPQLETAVIDYVAEFGQGLDVYQGFSREQMTRRVSLLAVVAAIIGIGVFTSPDYARVFMNRMLLGSMHYPTTTHIKQIVVNDTTVLLSEDDGTQPNDTAKAAQGSAVTFIVQCSGELPEAGSVALRIGKSNREETLKLELLTPADRKRRLEEALDEIELENDRAGEKIRAAWIRHMSLLTRFDAAEAAEALAGAAEDRQQLSVAIGHLNSVLAGWSDEAIEDSLYLATLERFSESPIDFGVTLGDAWTDLARLRMIPLPLVEVQSDVTPPDYVAVEPKQEAVAKKNGPNGDDVRATSLDIAVLEGSRVDLVISSSKPLNDATITIEERVYALVQTDKDGKQWRLPDGTPLAVVRSSIKYAIQVTDRDDLQLEYPKQGFVALKADKPPTIVAGIRLLETKSSVETPGGKPTLIYKMSDDHGIAKVSLVGEIIRREDEEGNSKTDPIAPLRVPLRTEPLLRKQGGLPTNKTAYRFHASALKLSDGRPAKLQIGDKLELRMAVTDYRGEFEGNVTLSDLLSFTITDDAGLIRATLAADKLSERWLNDAVIFAGQGDKK
ncbi:MAG: hypothetical protein IID44_10385 [Planctomycetes bacterium]|nr:hypothetical protein [Planctomycetota bacterium]